MTLSPAALAAVHALQRSAKRVPADARVDRAGDTSTESKQALSTACRQDTD